MKVVMHAGRLSIGRNWVIYYLFGQWLLAYYSSFQSQVVLSCALECPVVLFLTLFRQNILRSLAIFCRGRSRGISLGIRRARAKWL